MGSLQERTALVTGAGRGIGKAIALALGQAGAKVAAAARSTDELEDVVSMIRDEGGQAVALTADLSDRAVPAQLVSEVQERFGPVQILVNNAGLGSSSDPRPLVDFDDEFWDRSIAVNLTAPYLLCKAVLPDMLAKRWGRIITIASINGRLPSFHGAAYSASKHGVLGLTRTLALEVAGDGITVNAVCPGPVKTLMNDRRVKYDADRRGVDLESHEASLTPIGGRLAPDDIAPMVVYLAGDEARMITGQAYNIDGGISMV